MRIGGLVTDETRMDTAAGRVPPLYPGGVVSDARAALEQAIEASATVSVTVSHDPAAWPVTAIQIPWKEWTALVTAIREAS